MKIYTIGWWEFIGKNERTWEWQEIEVKAPNLNSMMKQIGSNTIDKLKKGIKKGTILGLVLLKPIYIY